MKEKNESKAVPDETVLDTCEDCGVPEDQFPHIGKCCRKRDGPYGVKYETTCPHCTVWISPPDPSSLDVAAIFECKRLGYCKRIKNI